MGCDIHAHVEVKISGIWYYYGSLMVWRDYSLFAHLADVRNDGSIEPLAQPRGLPEDVTEMTQIHSDHWGCDGHSHSWITSGEFIKADELYKFYSQLKHSEQSYLFGNFFNTYHKYPNDYPQDVEDFRMVFWFDN